MARSTARSASAHPCSGSPSTSWRCTEDAWDQPLDPHSDQAQPSALQSERVVEAGHRAVDLHRHVGRLGQGARARDRGEVGEADLEGDGAARHIGRPHPAAHPRREAQQLTHDHLAIVGVAGEGLVGAHRALGLVRTGARGQLGAVGAPGQVVELAAEVDTDRPLEGAQRGVGDVADGEQTETVEQRLRLLPHAVELTDVEGVQERGHLRGRHDEHAVGLGPPAGELGHRHRRRRPHRAGDALLVVDRRAQLLGDPGRRAEASAPSRGRRGRPRRATSPPPPGSPRGRSPSPRPRR